MRRWSASLLVLALVHCASAEYVCTGRFGFFCQLVCNRGFCPMPACSNCQQSGLLVQEAVFDEGSDPLEVTGGLSLDASGGITLSACVEHVAGGSASGLLVRNFNAADTTCLAWGINTDTNALFVDVAGEQVAATANHPTTATGTHHVTTTIQGAHVTFFVDGEMVGEGDLSGAVSLCERTEVGHGFVGKVMNLGTRQGALNNAEVAATAECPAQVREYDFSLDLEHISPDCVEKLARVVNRQFPGPTIRANVGDTVVVRFYNNIESEASSLHFHGILQVGEPWADGTPNINSCPVGPGGTHTYRFTLGDAQSPGTYFWHAHSGAQRDDGVFGFLIVDPRPGTPNPYPPYDEEVAMAFQDWYHVSHHEMLAGFAGYQFPLQATAPTYDEQKAQPSLGSLFLVNGRGEWNCDDSTGFVYARWKARTCGTKFVDVGRFGPPTGIEVPICPGKAVFTLQQGKTYRVRMLQPGFHNIANVKIEGHTMTVIEADGMPTEPVQMGDLDLMTGQRYSVLLETDQAPDNYWISVSSYNIPDSAARIRGQAVLRYEGAAVEDPSTSTEDFHPSVYDPEKTPPFWSAKIAQHDLAQKVGYGPQAPTNDEVTHRFVHKFMFETLSLNPTTGHVVSPGGEGAPFTAYDGAGPKRTWTTWNRHAGRALGSRLLYKQLLAGEPDDHPTTIHVPLGSVVDLVLDDRSTDIAGLCFMHAWHLHGHKVWEAGRGTTAWEGSDEQLGALNASGRVARDVVTHYPDHEIALTFGDSGPFPTFLAMGTTPFDQGDNGHSCGYTVLRFRADNPGPWLFHCHMTPHHLLGMRFLVVVGDAGDLPPLPAEADRCY